MVLKTSSRPTLRDRGQDQDRQCRDQDQDQDQDRKKSVSSGLETKTAVSRTTRLLVCNLVLMSLLTLLFLSLSTEHVVFFGVLRVLAVFRLSAVLIFSL